MEVPKLIQILARIMGTMSLIFLIFMLGAHLWDDLLGGTSFERFSSKNELFAFIGFPCMTIVGLALAWRWEGIGGGIVVTGMVILAISIGVKPIISLIGILASPSLLFIAYAIISRQKSNNQELSS